MPLPCPCLRGLQYDECCRLFLDGTVVAPTAERLMRSRYSAFALRDKEYLLRTWHPSTRPQSLELSINIRWCGLEIVTHTGGSLLENRGTVEFVARYRTGGKVGEQHENSRFVRENGQWLYVGIA